MTRGCHTDVLKPDGSRDGKVIDYAISEIRAIELMEVGIAWYAWRLRALKSLIDAQKACESMDDYTLTIHNGNQYYTKVKNNDGPLEIKGELSHSASGCCTCLMSCLGHR